MAFNLIEVFGSVEIFLITEAGGTPESRCQVSRGQTQYLCDLYCCAVKMARSDLLPFGQSTRLAGYYYCSFAPTASFHFPTGTANSRESNRFPNVSLLFRVQLLGLVRLKDSRNCFNKLKFLLIMKPCRNLCSSLPI